MVGRTLLRVVSIAAICAAYACGGGGGGSAHPVPVAPAAPAAPAASASPGAAQLTSQTTFRFTLPATGTAAAKRNPAFISAGTRSIQVTAANATASASAELDVTATTCPQKVCTLTVPAPVGADTFTIVTYDAVGGATGGGHVLSSASQPATVVAYQANAFNFTLGGLTAALKVTLANGFLPTGVAGTTTATVTVLDASGNQIVGNYETPVTLSAPSGISLGTTTFSSSSTTSTTVAYNGSARTALTITATDGTTTGTAQVVPTSNTVWIPIPGAQPGDDPFKMTVGPDGNVYYGELADITAIPNSTNLVGSYTPGRIGVINTTSGSVVEYQIGYLRSGRSNLGASPIGIAFKPGTQDLYVAAQYSGSVEKISNATGGGLADGRHLDVDDVPRSTASAAADAPGDLPDSAIGSCHAAVARFQRRRQYDLRRDVRRALDSGVPGSPIRKCDPVVHSATRPGCEPRAAGRSHRPWRQRVLHSIECRRPRGERS